MAQDDVTTPEWVTYYDRQGTFQVGKKSDIDPAALGTGGGLTTLIADDEDITVPAAAGTTIVLYTALTDARVVTLPPADGPSQIVIVKDTTGTATDAQGITVSAAGADGLHGPSFIGTGPDGTRGVLQFVNDGDADWVSPLDDSVRLTAVSANLSALATSLGGTDGDGNVYTIEFDPDGQELALKCTTPAGDVATCFVAGGGSAGIQFQEHDDGIQNAMNVNITGTYINGRLIELNAGSEGDVLTQQADGSYAPQTP